MLPLFVVFSILDMTKTSDAFLYDRVREADKQAFDQLFEKYWERLFLYAFKLLQDQDQAEDVVQEVFVQLWENAPRREIKHFSGYLFRSVKYQAALIVRKQQWKVDMDTLDLTNIPDFSEYDETELEIKLQQLDSQIEKLPKKCKEVFKLHKKDGIPAKEIAIHLGLSPRTVENQIQKAMRVLRSELGLYFFLMFCFGY